MQRLRRIVSLLAVAVIPTLAGCNATKPRNFRAMLHPAPIVRARAAGLNETQPDAIAIPTLIERLNDKDPVVRLTAHEALRDRTKQDFGYIPWADDEERSAAMTRWRSWWQTRRNSSYTVPKAALGKTRRRS